MLDSDADLHVLKELAAVKKLFVDIENASKNLKTALARQRNGYAFRIKDLYGHYETTTRKMSQVRFPVWVEENEPEDEDKKPLIERVLDRIKKAQNVYPELNFAPAIRFGYVERGELQQMMAQAKADKIALGGNGNLPDVLEHYYDVVSENDEDDDREDREV